MMRLRQSQIASLNNAKCSQFLNALALTTESPSPCNRQATVAYPVGTYELANLSLASISYPVPWR